MLVALVLLPSCPTVFVFPVSPFYSFVLPVLACFIVNTTSLSLPASCFLVPSHFHFCLIGLSHTCSGLSNQAHLVVISSSECCPFSPRDGLILLRTQCWCFGRSRSNIGFQSICFIYTAHFGVAKVLYI